MQNIREGAYLALEKTGNSLLKVLTEWQDIGESRTCCLIKAIGHSNADTELADVLTPILTGGGSAVRLAAIDALGQLEAIPEVLDLLSQCCTDDDIDICRRAVTVIGGFGPDADQYVSSLLQAGENPNLTVDVARALGRVAELDDCFDYMQTLIRQQPDGKVAEELCLALMAMRPASKPLLLELIKQSCESIRLFCYGRSAPIDNSVIEQAAKQEGITGSLARWVLCPSSMDI